MRYVFFSLVLLVATAARAQNGAEVYKTHCASCHSSGAARVPLEDALRSMKLTHVLAALETGVMKSVGDTLTPQERYAVAMYLSAAAPKSAPPPASAFCRVGAPPFRYSPSGARWMGWSTGVANTRFQNSAAAGITAGDVPKLKLKWAFALGDETNARSQPAVDGGRIFLGTETGAVYSLDARTGCIYWNSKIGGGFGPL